ncbi:MAG: hypothetical protein FJ303_24850 [Planctomycetes bacterium]|nr:hypothetical protein [Planctomycetota bacterium]
MLCRSRRSAISLTELLVVIAIISTLATLSFAFFRSAFAVGERYEVVAKDTKAKLQVAWPASATPSAAPIQAAPIAAAPAAAKKKVREPYVPPVVAAVPNEYIVSFAATVNDARAEAQRLAATYGAVIKTVYTRIRPACVLKASDQALEKIVADAAVKYIDKNYKFSQLQQVVPTGVRRSFSFPTVPANRFVLLKPSLGSGGRNLFFGKNGFGQPSIHVAVIDSGIDSKHPDLNVVRSVPFNGLPDGEDGTGHGTHVAGSIGARHNNAGVVGVYPGAPLWSLRIFDSAGSTTTQALLDSLAYVYDNANVIRVCNMSLGTGAIIKSVNDFVDTCAKRGVIMIAAAGNSGAPASGWTPASASLVVCVGALADSDGRSGGLGGVTSAGPDDTFADFSNYDYAVHVVAPGVDIYSTLPGGTYGIKSGTSMAAPHVAGYCALLLDPRTNFGLSSRNLVYNVRPPVASKMAGFLRQIATEQIPGILGDPLYYPMVNFHVQ